MTTETSPKSPRWRLDDGTMFWGILIGLVMGIVAWLPRLPRSGTQTQQQLRETLERDPIEESIAEGKALAQQRRHTTP